MTKQLLIGVAVVVLSAVIIRSSPDWVVRITATAICALVLGVGYGTGRLALGAHSARHESVMEVYYNAQLTPWLSVSPSIQYIFNPGGLAGVNDAVIVGLRAQISF